MLNRDEELRFCRARRAAIALDYQNLNPEQQKAVLATEGPLLLLAGAGSGKTTVLIHRVANLIRYGRGSDSDEVPEWITPDDLAFLEEYVQHPDPNRKGEQERLCRLEPAAPWSILAITFTNKAAGELKERLERQLGPQANDIWASTFHSACVRILRRDIEKLGFASSFTIYDTADAERVLKDIVKEFNLDDKTFAPRTLLGYISRAKDDMKTGAEYLQQCEKSGDLRLTKIAQIYAEYEKRLKAANALDFDDIILHTVRLLLNFEEVRSYWQKKFRYVLIDEYQDTNHLQYLLASTLAGGYENICVVGDDDQSIYRFRGATIENILSFESQYKGARVIRLEQNYRSTKNILEASNAVI
ncbi:MAG TPA: UvrD-helicase domain-containing protein, partial [Candidatus Flavonifractor merdipullorum]|nr:UvrD-helicase domain-containing protein [Candidatus Flavonifractor merdipullorum]